MSFARDGQEPAHVVIAGGGFAALEVALGLRVLAGTRVRLTLISPEPVLRARPAATREAFEAGPPLAYDLSAIARDLGAVHHVARLDAVAPLGRRVRLSTGKTLDYDALVLGIGARPLVGIPGALTFRDQRDLPILRRVLSDCAAADESRIVFALPTGVTWPLPLYELALLTARHAASHGLDVEVSLVTPERRPLEVFGARTARVVAGLLADQDVRFRGDRTPIAVRRDGALDLFADAAVPADHVVTIPQLAGHRIPGLPARWWGFVPTDRCGRVEGLDHVFAAGDMTAFPVKQGGLAAQQADRIAHTIAGELGAPVKEIDLRDVLEADLLGGPGPLHLRTELDWQGQPSLDGFDHLRSADTVPPTKVHGRYLTPYLEALEPLAA